MKRNLLITIILTLFASIIFITPALAFDLDTNFGAGNGLAQNMARTGGYTDWGELAFADKIGKIINIAMGLVGMVFLVLIFYAGYLWLTAQGEEENIKKAQKIIYGAVIGLVVLGSAYSIVNFVLPVLLKETTGESGGSKTTGGVVVEQVPCCQKCTTGMQPGSGSGACSIIPVDNNTMCQSDCQIGGLFTCYYSEIEPGKCVP